MGTMLVGRSLRGVGPLTSFTFLSILSRKKFRINVQEDVQVTSGTATLTTLFYMFLFGHDNFMLNIFDNYRL